MPFEVLAEQANAALDLSNVKIVDAALKSHTNMKKTEDRNYGKMCNFYKDFKERLDASIIAGRLGQDEVKAFQIGFKKEDEEIKAGETQDTQRKLQAQLQLVNQTTNRTRATNRNTQRAQRNRNLLEM